MGSILIIKFTLGDIISFWLGGTPIIGMFSSISIPSRPGESLICVYDSLGKPSGSHRYVRKKGKYLF